MMAASIQFPWILSPCVDLHSASIRVNNELFVCHLGKQLYEKMAFEFFGFVLKKRMRKNKVYMLIKVK